MKLLMRCLLALALLAVLGKAYQIQTLNVNAFNSTVNIVTQYSIFLTRQFTSDGTIAPWDTQLVPAGSNVVITFPSVYSTLAGYNCNTPYESCYVSGQKLIIPNLFPTDTALKDMTIVVNNVRNPTPATTTAEFMATIGNDYTVASANPNAVVILTPANFQSCTVSFSPGNVNRNASMVISATPTNSIPSDGTILVTFPNAGSWFYDIMLQPFGVSSSMLCINTTSSVMPSMTCAGAQDSNGSRTVIASGVFTASNALAFGFSIGGILSPPTTYPKDQIVISSQYNGYSIDTCTTTISGLVANNIAVNITPTTTMVVNQPVSLRFSVTLTDVINYLDTFLITFPTGTKVTAVTVSGGGTITVTNLRLTNLTLVSFSQSSANKNFLAGSNLNITFSNMTAPPSTQPTQPIYFSVLRDNFAKMTGSNTLQAVISTLSFTLAASSTLVNSNTTYTFNITILDALSSSGRIKIDFPAAVKPSWGSTTCAALSGSNTSLAPTCALSFNSLILTGINAAANNIGPQTLSVAVYGVTNPGSTEPSGNFTVTTYYSTTDDTSVATGTMGFVTATPANLSSSSVTIASSSYIVKATGVSYTVSVLTGNAIPQNGYIVIGIPLALLVNLSSVSSNCLFSIGNASPVSTVCTGTSNSTSTIVSFTKLFQGASVPANTTIHLKVASIFTNPESTLPVSSFAVATYSSTGYLIEQISAGLSVNMTTPAAFSSPVVSATSPANGATTDYSFSLSQPSTLSPSSFLDVIFPAEIIPKVNPVCKDLAGNILSCTLSGRTVSVLLPVTATANNIAVKVSGVTNSYSLKPSSPFGFRTRTPDGVGKYSEDLASMSVTNTVPSSFAQVVGVFAPRVFKSPVTLTVNFTPSNPNIGSVVVSLAPSFTVASASCQSFIAFSGSCLQSTSNPNMITVTGSFTSGSMSFAILGASSGATVPTDYTVLTTYDNSGYVIDQSQSDILFTLACQLPCRTCQGLNTNCTTCYNDSSITTSNYYYASGNACLHTCPTGFYADAALFICGSCSVQCHTCASNSTNCLSCVAGSGVPYLNTTASGGSCLAQCDSGMYPDSTNSCVLCQSPCRTCTGLTSCLSCVSARYFYQSNCLLLCPDNITVANASTSICDPCSVLCLTCMGSVANCTSCNVGTALYQGNCVTKCPDPLVNKTGVCQACDSPCLTCSQVSTNCTSCISTSATPHYHNNSCLDACPSTYYNQTGTSSCQLCSTLGINCVLCFNATSCIACDPGFVFFSPNSSCLSFTPSGYANVSGKALPCDGDCSTCSLLVTNCTSCKTLNLLGNQCLAICPSNFAPAFGVCTACQSPCLTCSQTIANCTSCASNLSPQVYLSGNKCVQTCPSTTYANLTLQECVVCVSPCQTCTSQTICDSCVSGYNLYLTSCLNGFCPGGFTPVASKCMACQSPCLTCSTSPTTCTACLHGMAPELYLINTTCVQGIQCPSGTYPDTSSNLCAVCQPPCSTCTSATVCLSCLSGYNLDGSLCKSNCSDGYIPINAVCTTCTSPCATCAGALTTCLTCRTSASGNSLYLNAYRCLATCPNSTYPNGLNFQCSPCQSPCSSCNALSNCTQCMGGYFLYGAYCYTSCPLGYVGIAITCEKCSAGCLSCQNSTFTCIDCQAGYYKMNLTNECVLQCPLGLYADPIQSVCIGCTLPCSGCTGITTNCTICATGSLYNNSCVSLCPDAHFSFNAVCLQCAVGCISCTSLARCVECNATLYSLDNTCVAICPPSKAIVLNKTCTACTKLNCKQCTSSDYCTVCNAPTLVHSGQCVQACPANFTSNGTHCVAVIPNNNTTSNQTTTKQSSSIFPMPFSIAAVVVVVLCAVSKFQSTYTFASGAVYGLMGVLEWGSLAALAVLYAVNYALDFVFWIVAGAILFLYVLNVLGFVMMLGVYKRDSQFGAWSRRTCSSKASFIVALCVGLCFSHKYYNVLFSRLFGFFAFKARLDSVSKFFWLHLLSLVSLVQSMVAIAVASYIIHETKASVNQTLLCALDAAAIHIVNILLAGSNAHKTEQFFAENDGDVALNKKIDGEESCQAKSVDHAGSASERESAYCGRRSYGDPIVSLMSIKQINDRDDKEEEVGEFVVQELGDRGQPIPPSSEGESIFSSGSRSLADVSVQALEILEQPEQSASSAALNPPLVFNFEATNVLDPSKPTGKLPITTSLKSSTITPLAAVQPPKSAVQILVEKIQETSVSVKPRKQTEKTVKTEKTENIFKPEREEKVDEGVQPTVLNPRPMLVEVKRKSRYDDWLSSETMQSGVQLEPSRLEAAATHKHVDSKGSQASEVQEGVRPNEEQIYKVVPAKTISAQPINRRHSEDESREELKSPIRDSPLVLGIQQSGMKSRTPSPSKREMDNQAKARNAQRQEELERTLREKEKELVRIRRQVQEKERQRQLAIKSMGESQLILDSPKKVSSRQTSNFTAAAQVQDPLQASKALKKEDIGDPIMKSGVRGSLQKSNVQALTDIEAEDTPNAGSHHLRSYSAAKPASVQNKSNENEDPTLLSQVNTVEDGFHEERPLRLENSQQNPTPLTDGIIFAEDSSRISPTHRTVEQSSKRNSPKSSKKIKVEDIELEKSSKNSQDEISASPLRLKQAASKLRAPFREDARQGSEFSEPREQSPRLPIMLLAGNRTNSTKKRSTGRKNLERNELQQYRTVQLERAPEKSGLVFNTNDLVESDEADLEFTGVSPSQFNTLNQRLQAESEIYPRSSLYEAPAKPKVIKMSAYEGMSDTQSREIGKRSPIMIGVSGQSGSLERPFPSDAEDGLKDYYEAEKKLPKWRPTRTSSQLRQPNRTNNKQH